VALIAESALKRDLGDRLRRLGKRTGGQVDAQAADALAEGFPVVRPKTPEISLQRSNVRQDARVRRPTER